MGSKHTLTVGLPGAVPGIFVAIAVAIATMAVGGTARAEDGTWVVRAEAMYMDAWGHDQHVLTIHDIDSAAHTDAKSAVLTDIDSGNAFRLGTEYVTARWRWGFEMFAFYTKQSVTDRDMAASGSGREIAFEVPDRVFTSSGPSEALYYRLLEDNDLETWTFDIYGVRSLVDSETSALGVQFGIRSGDFDNDYHAAIGVGDSGGVQIDASSNYDRMTGPLVGFVGTAKLGRSSIHGSVRQSILLGSVELSTSTRDFVGAFSATPEFVSQETIRTTDDVAIPVTDVRLEWSYELGPRFTVGVGASGSAWWDVSIPPGVVPGEGGNEALLENTIVYFGMSATVTYSF